MVLVNELKDLVGDAHEVGALEVDLRTYADDAIALAIGERRLDVDEDAPPVQQSASRGQALVG